MGYFAPSSSSYSSSATSSASPSTSSETLFVAVLEAGLSSCAAPSPPLPLAMARRAIAPENLYRRSGGFLGARPAAAASRLFLWDGFDDDEPRYFLDSCFRCKKSLSGNCDIYMYRVGSFVDYRGDTPFCSEECRQEQIEIDEERENDRKLHLKASSIKDRKAKSSGATAASSPPKSPSRYHLRATGAVVAS